MLPYGATCHPLVAGGGGARGAVAAADQLDEAEYHQQQDGDHDGHRRARGRLAKLDKVYPGASCDFDP